MTTDPILLEVLRNRLDAIADEMELTLLKSAASPIVKEGLDASAALFNTRGETIAQAAAIPIHLGALQFAARRIVRAFPPDGMREGDAFLLNDPYDGGTHLPDITLAVPVFADGRAVALACTMCHHQDVGGRTPGSVPTDATELYQEGVIIPPTQLFRAGELDENLFRLLTRNVRLPDVFTGDLMAQVAAGRLGGVRLRELFAAHGAATVVAYIEELLARVDAIRRRLRLTGSPKVRDTRPIQVGRVRIDPSTRTVYAGDEVVSLRPKEFDLLLALARRGGGVASRFELLEEVWGYDADVVSRTVDTHVGQLRTKLEADPHAPRLILTVRKSGYRLAMHAG